MKKIFLFLMMLACYAGSAWGQNPELVVELAPRCEGTKGTLIVTAKNAPSYPVSVTVLHQSTSTSYGPKTIQNSTSSVEFEVDAYSAIPQQRYLVKAQGFADKQIQVPASSLEHVGFHQMSPTFGIDCPDKGKIAITGAGGTTPYTFVIRWGAGEEKSLVSSGAVEFTDLSRDVANIYEVQIEDANHCLSEIKSNSFDPYTLEAEIAAGYPKNVTCNGNNNGEVTITAEGGNGGKWFQLEDGYIIDENDNGVFTDLEGAEGGKEYTFIVSDATCSVEETFTITEPPVLTAVIVSKTDPLCDGTPDGEVTVRGVGGTPPYTFTLNGETQTGDVNNEATFDNLAEGTYSLVVTDQNNCEETIEDFVTLEYPDPLRFTVVGEDPTCAGANDGTVTVSYESGEGTVEYRLDHIDGDGDMGWQPELIFENLEAGTYQVVGKNEHCEWMSEQTKVILNDPTPVEITNPGKVDVLCFGASTGEIQFTVTGKTGAGFQYSISSDEGANWTSWANVPAGGVVDHSNLSAGTYWIKAEETNGNLCKSEIYKEIIVTQPTELTVAADPTPLTCEAEMDDPDGSIRVTVSGGTAPYTYQIKESETNDPPFVPGNRPNGRRFTNLSAGTYSITVKDANGCTQSVNDIVVESAAPVTANISHTPDPITCAGDVTITVDQISGEQGRNLEYRFNNQQWIPVNASGEFERTVNASGEYHIQVRYRNRHDFWQCADFDENIEITIPDAIEFSLSSTPATCYDGNDGSIAVTATGGSGSYNYEILDEDESVITPTPTLTNNVYSGLKAGSYFIKVTDASDANCLGQPEDDAEIEVEQPEELTVTVTETTMPTCFGSEDGEIVFTITGGTLEYSITMARTLDKDGTALATPETKTPESEVTEGTGKKYTFTGLLAGTYTVTGNDINNCPIEETIVLENPLELTVSAIGTSIDCPNAGDVGEIVATVENATLPFPMYTLFIKDNGVYEEVLPASLYPLPNESTPPFSKKYSNLKPGEYKVKVTFIAEGNCIDETPDIIITRPEPIDFTATPAEAMLACDAATTSITVTVNTPAFAADKFAYRLTKDGSVITDWTALNAATEVIKTDAGAGAYKVEMAYSGNEELCEESHDAKTFTIGVLDGLSITATGTANKCFGRYEGTITVVPSESFPSTGVTYTLYKQNEDGQYAEYKTGSSLTFTGLPGGYYRVVASFEGNSCTYSYPENMNNSIDLTDPKVLEIDYENTLIFNPCLNSSDGEIHVKAKGGTPPYTFELNRRYGDTDYSRMTTIPNNPNTDGIFTGLPVIDTNIPAYDHKYYVEISDATNECWIIVPVPESGNLEYPEPLVASFEEDDVTHVYCEAGLGEATVTVTGGRKPYTYDWKAGENWVETETSLSTDAMVTGLSIGWYSVKVIDECGEEIVKSIEIKDHILRVSVEDYQGAINCDGSGAGLISIITTGGKPVAGGGSRYTYTVSKDGINYEPNTENVEITTDEEAQSETYTITGLDEANETGSIYVITVADGNDATVCTVTTGEITIDNPEALNVSATPIQPLCFGGDATFTVNVSGGNKIENIDNEGTPGYKMKVYNITGDPAILVEDMVVFEGESGEITISMLDIAGGETRKYRIEIEDATGCKVSSDFNLTNPVELWIRLEVVSQACPSLNPSTGSITDARGGGSGVLKDQVYYKDGIQIPAPSNFNSIEPGEYYFEAYDANGCYAKSNTVKIGYDVLSFGGTEVSPVTCENPASGSVKVIDIAGGNGDDDEYAFQVFDKDGNEILSQSTAEDNITITGLSHGEYYIEMRHGKVPDACIPMLRIPETDFITITTTNTIDFADNWYTIVQDPSCFNSKDGAIAVNTPPVEGEFEYTLTYPDGVEVTTWLSTAATPPALNTLGMGEYKLHIRDMGQGCVNEESFTIGDELPTVKITPVSELIIDECDKGHVDFEMELVNANINDVTLTPSTGTTGDERKETEPGSNKWIVSVMLTRADAEAGKDVILTADINGCSIESDPKTVTFPKGIEVEVNQEEPCAAETTPVQFYFTSGTAPFHVTLSSLSSAEWIREFDVAESNVAAQYPDVPSGQYTLKITDNAKCSYEKTITILGVIKPEELLSSITNATCAEMDMGNGSINLKLGANTYDIWWKEPNKQDRNVTGEYTLPNLTAGDYEMQILYSGQLDANTCETFHTFTVGAANNVAVNILGGEEVYCPGIEVNLTGAIEHTDASGNTVTGSTITGEWTLIDDETLKKWESGQALTFNPTEEGSVTLAATVTLADGISKCTSFDNFEVKLSTPEPIDFGVMDTVIYIPDDADFGELNIISAPEGDRNWTSSLPGYEVIIDSESPDIVKLPRPDQELMLTLTVASTCPSVGRIRIALATGFHIPNVITPNLDGVNDTWMFRNLEKYTGYYDVQVAVFNRGGSQVFSASQYSNDKAWDGCRAGQDLPIGTYHYVVKLIPRTVSGGKPRIVTGSVTIIR